MYQNIIETLSSDNYYRVKKDIKELVNDEEFIEIITKIHNPFVFDRFIKMCEFKIDTSSLYENRNRFIKRVMNSINRDNCYKLLELSDMALVNRYLTEYIISYYFEDNYYNFLTNFYQMISYLKSVKDHLVDDEHIKIYSEFMEITKASFEDKINLFKLYLDSNLRELFYDDLNIVRTDAHKKLVSKSLKLEKDSNIYQKGISKRLDVPVYYLDGEEFYGFVRCFSSKSDELNSIFENDLPINSRLGYSYSYIGHNNIGTIGYGEDCTTLFYDKINYQDIIYVHHADMHIKKMDIQDDYLSEKENEILLPESLIAKTKNYNEIYIKNYIKPTAIVCYDHITYNDIAMAIKNDLSILVINSKKYKYYKTYDDDYDSYKYVI